MHNIIDIWATFWPAGLIGLGVPLATLRVRRRVPLAPWPAYVLPVLGPISVITWAGAFWGAEREHVGGPHWVGTTFAALVWGSLILILGVVVRYRRAPRYWIVVALALFNLVFLLGVVFYSMIGMSSGAWL